MSFGMLVINPKHVDPTTINMHLAFINGILYRNIKENRYRVSYKEVYIFIGC